MKPLALALLLTSCGSVPLVQNRNAQGEYITPACPQCGLLFNSSATLYQDPNGHYGIALGQGVVTPTQPLPPAVDPTKLRTIKLLP